MIDKELLRQGLEELLSDVTEDSGIMIFRITEDKFSCRGEMGDRDLLVMAWAILDRLTQGGHHELVPPYEYIHAILAELFDTPAARNEKETMQ